MSETMLAKSPVVPGDLVAGKYRVERVLGAGGMGVVVAARHVDLDQPVALKFILPHALTGKGNVERFMREARAVVRLKSEHVARVYDVGRDAEDRPFIVLELLEGLDLAKLNKQQGPLPVADAVEYLLQACEALVEAHASGIVHRDLKPQNIFVTRHLNGTALVKVLDFGIAKAIGPGAEGQMALTDSAAIIGSPLYMAPEQMRSARSANVRSDIWALGVILYELLGGQIPFDGETVTEVCIRVVNEAPTSLLELRPGLDPALVAIVMRCLQKEPEARYHNVAALATAIEPFSRSAKLGGPVRSWRSLDDTQDSEGGGNPFAGTRAHPDATGPSTAVTLKTLDDVIDVEEPNEATRRARELAGSTKWSRESGGPAGSGKPGSTPPLVSTDVTWGDSGSKPPGAVAESAKSASSPRTFSTRMVLGLVASAAAAAVVVGLFLGRGASGAANAANAAGEPAAAAANAPLPAMTSASDPAGTRTQAVPSNAEPLAAAAEPPLGPAAPPRVITPATSASVAARLLSTRKTRRGPAHAAPADAVAAPPARPAEPKSATPLSPNGAPILR